MRVAAAKTGGIFQPRMEGEKLWDEPPVIPKVVRAGGGILGSTLSRSLDYACCTRLVQTWQLGGERSQAEPILIGRLRVRILLYFSLSKGLCLSSPSDEI